MRQRWVAIVVIASTVVVAATCVHDDLIECAGGVSCPVGKRCVEDSELSQSTCADQDQFDACRTDGAIAPTGTQCTIDGQTGTCFGGACIVENCGDAVIEGREACDDGNTIGSDGCSSNCASKENCGDGVIDLVQGEQCDDGVRGLSGDGCSSVCKIEYAFWRDVTPPMPTSRYSYGLARSPSGRILMFGGTSGSGGTAQSASYSETWEHDGVTWGKLAPASSPPTLTRVAMAYDPRRNRVVMFGGIDGNGVLHDNTWEFDGVTWTKLSPATKPPMRLDPAFACSPNRCVLFGGGDDEGGGSGSARSDSWEWDGTTWTEIPTSGSGTPNARIGAGMAFDEMANAFVLWGGHTGSGGSTDTNTMSDATPTHWSVATAGPTGSSSGLPAIAYSEQTRTTWTWTDSGTWIYAAGSGWGSAATLPGQQNVLVWNAHAQRLTGASNTMLDRTYTHEGSGWVLHTNLRPTGQRTAAAAYDSLRGLTTIYERVGGTWEWDGTIYRQAAPAAPLTSPNVDDAALVFDEACRDIILFGGLNLSANATLADTWRFDGAQWQKLPITGPPSRSQHVMVYDPVRNATIVFGGSTRAATVNTRLGDTWQLSGPCGARIWTELPVTGPSPRVLAATAFDRDREVVVLFGGMNNASNKKDVWEWDGSAWHERMPADGPTPRQDAALAFDPRLRRIVLSGGRVDDLTRLSDVWTWNGTEWTELVPLVAPMGRSGAQLVPDRTGSLVMYGGDTVIAIASMDLQRLRFDQTLHPNERCMLATDDIDRDGLLGCDDPDCRSRCAPLCSPTTPLALCTGPRCGDGECSAVEDARLCPSDCVD